ncbi:MAG: hypothetical protein Q7T53_02880 [Deltaproteobacteria bacterium]|nr:hypothetical protein [Deltaproteobacteria bacterium]
MPSREIKILIALISVLTALVIYRVATKEEPKRVRELTFKPVVSGQRSAVSGEKTPPLTSPLSPPWQGGVGVVSKGGTKGGVEKKPYRGVIRNPFRSLYPPPPPPPQILPKLPVAPPPAPFPVITTTVSSPAQIESGRIKFLGFLQKEGDRKIFLSKDKEVFIVKKGDNIGVFEVGDISDSSVTLIARDTKEEFQLIIEDVKPTKPGILPGSGRR